VVDQLCDAPPGFRRVRLQPRPPCRSPASESFAPATAVPVPDPVDLAPCSAPRWKSTKANNPRKKAVHRTVTIRKGSGPEVTAGIRRLALNILQRDSSVRDNIRGKRLRAGWDETVLDQIYTAFSMN